MIMDASVFGPTACLTGTTYQSSGLVSFGGLRGVMRVATSTASQGIALPSTDVPASQNVRPVIALQGKYLRLKNESALYSLDFAFGHKSLAAAPTLVYGQLATMAVGHVSAGWRLDPLQALDVIVPPDAAWLSHILDPAGAASTLAMYCSEGNRGEK